VKAAHPIRPVFDDPNLVSCAGLVPALRLAESAGLHELLAVKCPLTSQAACAGWTGTIRPTTNIRLRTAANTARPMLE